jgi:hypothetical protein
VFQYTSLSLLVHAAVWSARPRVKLPLLSFRHFASQGQRNDLVALPFHDLQDPNVPSCLWHDVPAAVKLSLPYHSHSSSKRPKYTVIVYTDGVTATDLPNSCTTKTGLAAYNPVLLYRKCSQCTFDKSLHKIRNKNKRCQGGKSPPSAQKKVPPLNGRIFTIPAARTAIMKADRPYP